ncbi:unnamed protein product [Caenorhabditis brenneri]
MAMINTSAVIFSTVGIVSSLFTVSMNTYLLVKYKKKKEDMRLFYCKFAIDVLMGITEATFLTFVIFYATFYEFLKEYKNFIIYFGLSGSILGAVRAIITLVISFERVIATYTPIFYHNHQSYFSPLLVMAIAIIFGSTEPITLFGVCNYRFEIPSQCAALGCAINQCFFQYWNTHKLIVFAFTLTFSILLCLKLLILNKNNPSESESVQLSRVNRLALIESAIILVFNLLQNLLAGQFPNFFSFQNLGPHGSVSKVTGCAIESYLIFVTLSRKSSEVPTDSIWQKMSINTSA